MDNDDLKNGDKVLVEGLYGLYLEGEGVYLGVSREHHYEGYYRILNEYGHVMKIHPNRVSKIKE